MNNHKNRILSVFILIFGIFSASELFADKNGLSSVEKAIVPIAAFTANGDIERLKISLNEGLDAGLTVNEIKEILVHLYAYTGFPRSLNGIVAFMDVMEDREKRGIKDKTGREASPFPKGKTSLELGTENQTALIGRPASGKYITFTPAIDQFLKAHLFGDIFGRDILNTQTREIVTISALSNMERINPQLKSHFRASMNTGLTEAKIKEIISVLGEKVSKRNASNAYKQLDIALGKSKEEQEKIVIWKKGTLPSRKAGNEHFTGNVYIDRLFATPHPSYYSGGNVSFEKGAKTAWHTHKKGQLLIITSGKGNVQMWNGPVQVMRKGDVVWIPPYVKHWHGASKNSPVEHIAIVENLNGQSTKWLEKVEK